MTVIAAYLDHEGNAAIGCDQAVSYLVQTRVGSKLWQSPEMVVGVVGSFGCVAGFLDGGFGNIRHPTELAARWRAWAVEHCHGAVEDGLWQLPARLVVLYNCRPWLIDGSCHAYEVAASFVAAGSGECTAAGALYVARTQRVRADVAVREAVQACIAMEPDCGGQPVVVMRTARKAPDVA